MKQQPTPDELLNSDEYELIKRVQYAHMKQFIMEQIKFKNKTIRIYALAQVLAGILLLLLLANQILIAIQTKAMTPEMTNLLIGLLFSFTVLIILHEALHALAFIIMGKRNISFGAQWEKFIFYAEADRQVLNRRQMLIVALSPLVLIALMALLGIVFTNFPEFFLFVFLIHFFFCAGDIAIVVFMNDKKYAETYTFDNRVEKVTYYFGRV